MIEKPLEIRELGAGAANQVVLLRGHSTDYIFKWLRHNQQLGLDRNAEFELQRKLAALQLAPEVIACDPNRWVLQRFVDGIPLAKWGADSASRLQIAARTLAKIHAQRPRWQGATLWQKCEQYVRQLDTAAQQALRHFREELRSDSPAVLCHFDLSFEHILLRDKGVSVIDWEYAGWGDRLTDIASTIEINQLSDASADILNDYYQQATGVVISQQQLHRHRLFVRWLNQQWAKLLQLT